jgi:hypothetical protein
MPMAPAQRGSNLDEGGDDDLPLRSGSSIRLVPAGGRWVLPPARGDVEERVGTRAIVGLARTVAPALEPGRTLPSALSPVVGAGGR